MKKRRKPNQSSRQPSPKYLEELLNRCEIHLKPGQLEKLWQYHNLLRKRNQDRDLTRLIGFQTIAIKHYADSLLVSKMMRIPSPIVDIGTGAGFPGIPLKILIPNLELTLAEPRPRRVAFLREVQESLGLKKLTIFDHRVVSRSFQVPMKGVITRALETMDKTMARTSACLEKGGLLIYMKGPNCSDEIKECRKRFYKKYKLVEDTAYRIGSTENQRRLVVYERLIPPEIPKD